MHRTQLVTLIAASGFALGAEAFPLTDGALSPAESVADVLVALSFIVAGTYAWWQRPENQTGRLMVAVGVAWSLANLMYTDMAVVHAIGLMALGLFGAPLSQLLLAFPSGRLRTRRDRWVVAAIYVHLGPQWWLVLAAGLYDELWLPHSLLSAVCAVVVFTLLYDRWRAASPPARRALNPVLASGLGAALVVCITAPIAFAIPSDGASPSGPVHLLWAAAFTAVPVGFVAGLLRTRVSRAPLAELVRELSEPLPPLGLRAALARALGDPSLELGFRVDGRDGYHDPLGRPLPLPAPREGRAVTRLEAARDVVLVHDPALRYDLGLLEAVGHAARLALENERLHAELRAQLVEVRAARARLVSAQDTERRRIERDLHDGAQQTLVTLSLALRLLEERILRTGAAGDLGELVASSAGLADRAVHELRDLARGVYPMVLASDGLEGALESLALASALRVELEVALARSPGLVVETAGYFVCCEALTNAGKHAGAGHVRVRAREEDGHLIVDVSDDGAGGADPARGTGLVGLADRVAALGGRLAVDSPAGGGTRVTARIPFAQDADSTRARQSRALETA